MTRLVDVSSPFQYGDRTIGTVESVAANRLLVRLMFDAPGSTTLAGGWPSTFPRINGYLLIPTEAGATIGMITEVFVQKAVLPRISDQTVDSLVDLPQPSRLLSLVPIGTLIEKHLVAGDSSASYVRRGVDVFPSVGDPVLLPTREQLHSMIEGEAHSSVSSGSRSYRRVLLGTCPTAASAKVYFDPDKLFGRHLAVLGNTGSGKSCSVAGIIRWSLETAAEVRGGKPNARFIILDPNGEYSTAFQDFESRGQVRRFGVDLSSGLRLQVPAWLWNAEEWTAFTAAAPGVQRPLLYNALRILKQAAPDGSSGSTSLISMARHYQAEIHRRISAKEYSSSGMSGCSAFGSFLNTMAKEFETNASNQHDSNLNELLKKFSSVAKRIEAECRERPNNDRTGYYYSPFPFESANSLETKIDSLVLALERLAPRVPLSLGLGEDAPRPFAVESLASLIETLGHSRQGRDVGIFVDTLRLRIDTMLGSAVLSSIINPSPVTPTLAEWLESYIGTDNATNGSIAIIDLSLVPSEIVHIVISVFARMVFEASQRYRRESIKNNRGELPTVLVLDEAHTFVHRDLANSTSSPAGDLCCRTFERIAREGRKFGLGLVLASQRPSEISPTVLSQCNTFLLHRIVNDLDQQLVRSLVPDGLGDMLRELPSLPSRRAILLGWAAPAPILVEVTEMQKEQRPLSPDPPFWDVWIGAEERKIDWDVIAQAWGGPADYNLLSKAEELQKKTLGVDLSTPAEMDDDIPF